MRLKGYSSWCKVIFKVAVILSTAFSAYYFDIFDHRVGDDTLMSHVEKVCSKMNMSLLIGNDTYQHIHVDHKRKVLYCFIPKVACTSWKRIWMKTTGMVSRFTDISQIPRFIVHRKLHTLAYEMERAPEVFEKYQKFMFVRHPFDRVLSAYKDKLESKDTETTYDFHQEIGIRIQKKYGRPWKKDMGSNVSFSDFMRYISEPGEGTFEQRNEHWLTIHRLCNPCRIKYDFIGKFENLKSDAQLVLESLGVLYLVPKFPVPDRPFYAKHYDPKYFNKLDHEIKAAFFQKYLFDFKAFNYSIL